MVSTRLMSVGNASTSDSNAHQYYSDGPARFTRNSVSSSGNNSLQCYKALPQPVQSVWLLDLPQEVIERIFGFLTFKEVCKLRLVCSRVNQICSYILNSTFSKLQNQMLQRFQDIKSKMPRRESARRSHYLAGEIDIIETLHMRLTLLQMSFGKHIERKHCCFFPGEILDEVYSVLNYIRTTSKLDLPYKVTDELFDLSTMAMEYFREVIEPNLPEITCFSADFLNFASASSSKYMPLESSVVSESSKGADPGDPDALDSEDLVEIPQSNMVLRKRIRKIKQGMKRYNNQLSVLRQELKACKKKTTDQQKQITDQQKQLADQQKQTLEYATRLDEYDKKNEEISRKFSTLLQELNKCKTELQYWRCKSPAAPPVCNACGSPVAPNPTDLQALMNQGINPEGFGLEPISDLAVIPASEQSTSKITEEANDSKDTKDKKSETPPGSPTATARGSKRKLSEEVHEELQVVSKKSRRLSKTRTKRSKV